MVGLDHPIAWEIREACLISGRRPRSRAWVCWSTASAASELLRARCSGYPEQSSLLKQAAAMAPGRHHTRPQILAA